MLKTIRGFRDTAEAGNHLALVNNRADGAKIFNTPEYKAPSGPQTPMKMAV